MSVTTSYAVHVTPIYRGGIPGQTPALIATWNSSGPVTGDGSGGTLTYQVTFGTAGLPFMYGQQALLTIDCWSWYSSLTHSYVYLAINLLEPSNPSVMNFRFQLGSSATIYDLSRFGIFPQCFFRVGPGASTIDFVADNVNLASLVCAIQGRIFDEKLI